MGKWNIVWTDNIEHAFFEEFVRSDTEAIGKFRVFDSKQRSNSTKGGLVFFDKFGNIPHQQKKTIKTDQKELCWFSFFPF